LRKLDLDDGPPGKIDPVVGTANDQRKDAEQKQYPGKGVSELALAHEVQIDVGFDEFE
jgi:hypothetical protein